MKKLAPLAALVVLGGMVAYRRVAATRAEEDLWREATDPVTPGR